MGLVPEKVEVHIGVPYRRPRFVAAASRPARAVLRFDKELHSSWNILKQRGGFHSNSQFVEHLLFSGGVQAESAGSVAL